MNRSYLFSLDIYPDGLKPHAIALSESKANIPLIYRILVSQNPRATESILFSGNEKIAITADYEAGVDQLSIFFAMLPEEYQEKASKVIAFLRSEKNKQKLIHLECAEIFEMADGELEEQNAALLAELSDIDSQIADALNDIENGDVSDLQELDEEYWSHALYYKPAPDEKTDEILDAIISQSGALVSKDSADILKSDLLRDYDEADEDDGESDEPLENNFDPKNPGSKKYRNCEINMAEPELYTHKDTGEQCGGFVLKEGVITALPIAPEDMYIFTHKDEGGEENEEKKISDWRLFLYDSDGECLCVLEYHRAIRALQFLAEYGEKYLIGEKDGYAVTTPLTRDELQKILDVVNAATENADDESKDEAESDESETVYVNPDDPNAPYLTRLAARKKLFLPCLFLTTFFNAASYITGLINMNASEKLSLFLHNLAFSAALFALSYIAGFFLLSLVPRFFKKKSHTILKVIAILCIIDILLRIAQILVFRSFSGYAANPFVFSLGTLFALFAVWEQREHMFRRILYASFAIVLSLCWRFWGLAKGSAVSVAVALLVFGGICLFNAIADSKKTLLHRIGKKCSAFFKSWKVRIVLVALPLSLAFFVHWLEFQAGITLWAVFVVAISIIAYALHSMFEIFANIFGNILGDKLARDGVSFDDSGIVEVDAEEENEIGEMGEQQPNIRLVGKSQCGFYSLSTSSSATIPLDPKAMFDVHHSDGKIRPVPFWRLILYGAEGEKLGDIEYYRAVFYLKNLIDDVEVKTLGDGYEYLVFEHGLLESELKSVIEMAKDDAETDDAGYEQTKSSKFWEEGVEQYEEERWEKFLKSDKIFPETLKMADGTYRAIFYLREGERALLPLDPADFRRERDNGEVLPFDEYRLWVFKNDSPTPIALDYKRAVALITLIIPNADFSVRTLSDDCKYLAINKLTGDELDHLVKAAKDAEKTKQPFDNLFFKSLGKDGTPCGILTLTAGQKAVFPIDPIKQFKTKSEDGDNVEQVKLWRLFLYDENGELLGDVNYYHAKWWLVNYGDSEKIGLDEKENFTIEPLSREEILELKNAVDCDYNEDDRKYFSLKAEEPAKNNHDENDGGQYTHEQAMRILQKLHEMTALPAVRINVEDRTEKPPLSPTASKFGGLPYWTRGEEYPKDENGNPLYLLAQINFADVPHIPDYPTHGLLQIFIANDDQYGWDAIEHGTKTPQKNWRVVWRDVVSPGLSMSAAELSAIGVHPAQKYYTDEDGDEFPLDLPIQNEFGLTFEKIESHINPSCDGFDEAVKNAAASLALPVFAGWAYEWFSDVDYQAFWGDGRTSPHQIGGHPQFTQGEMRPEGDILLLFQMASEWIATGGDDDDDCGAIWESRTFLSAVRT